MTVESQYLTNTSLGKGSDIAGRFLCGVRHMQTADLQTCRLQTCRLADCRLADLQTCRLQTCRLADCRLADLQTWRLQTEYFWIVVMSTCHAAMSSIKRLFPPKTPLCRYCLCLLDLRSFCQRKSKS